MATESESQKATKTYDTINAGTSVVVTEQAGYWDTSAGGTASVPLVTLLFGATAQLAGSAAAEWGLGFLGQVKRVTQPVPFSVSFSRNRPPIAI